MTAGGHDVAILGGGPAGSATALALKRRDPALRVLLVEQTGYSRLRIGETLPPPAQRLLYELGVWDAFLRRAPLESYGTRAAWGGAGFEENEFIFSPYGRGWHLDRRNFDAFLADAAEQAGVEVARQTVARADRDGGAWSLTLQASSRTGDGSHQERHRALVASGSEAGLAPEGGSRAHSHIVRARVVVDATGRRSAFAATQGARHIVFDRLVGAALFFRLDPGRPGPDSYASVEACEEGWWYTATTPDRHMAAIFMTDADRLRRLPWQTVEQWSALAARAPHTADRLGGGVPIGVPSIHAASSQRLDVCAGDGWLAVGDAAGTFDPLSSQGVMKALRSGINASRAICRSLAGNTRALAGYGALLAKEYDDYLDGRAAYYALERRWPASPFWQRRHETITLDPMQRLQFVRAGQRRPVRATRLAAGEMAQLADLCLHPRLACEVISLFQARCRQVHSDRQVLLALQDLIARGVVSALADRPA